MNKLKTVCLLVPMLLGSWESGVGQQVSGPSFPIIVVRISRFGQTAPIPPMELLKPKKTTLYRVSVFADNFVPLDNDSYWCVQFNWTDSGGAQINSVAVPTSPNDQGTNNYSPWVSTFAANAETPVIFSVIASGTSPTCGGPGYPSPLGSTFDLFVTVEKLM